jgi:polar amino acid transport system substrate-binding protein
MRQKLGTAIVVMGVVAVSTTVLLLGMFRDQSLTRLQQAGTIRIGYAIEAPYAFLKPGGEVTGEFPEVAKRIVADLGIRRIEWIQTDFGSLIPSLEAGRFDVIAAGLYITPERAQRVDFSEPVLHVQQGLLVRQDNPRQLYSYRHALTPADVKIAVIAGAVEEALLRRIGLSDRQIVIVPDALTGRVAVESGLADGLALTSPTIRWMASRDQLGKTDMAQPFEQPDPALTEGVAYCGFAFRKADRQLLAAWNSAMQPFITSQEHLKLLAEFGFTEAELPGAVTTREILSK